MKGDQYEPFVYLTQIKRGKFAPIRLFRSFVMTNYISLKKIKL